MARALPLGFPEKLSAFNWARRISTAPTAVMNMVSSNFNQWTVLAATLPIVYSVYGGELRSIHFDDFQCHEILLTLSQSSLGMVLLLNMNFSGLEAAGIFVLWLLQFVVPESRQWVTGINFAWAGLELSRSVMSRRGDFQRLGWRGRSSSGSSDRVYLRGPTPPPQLPDRLHEQKHRQP
ncbi:MAG: hypothetical protein U0527_00400 [Candidatus Eisenbacteria bacterium]